MKTDFVLRRLCVHWEGSLHGTCRIPMIGLANDIDKLAGLVNNGKLDDAYDSNLVIDNTYGAIGKVISCLACSRAEGADKMVAEVESVDDDWQAIHATLCDMFGVASAGYSWLVPLYTVLAKFNNKAIYLKSGVPNIGRIVVCHNEKSIYTDGGSLAVGLLENNNLVDSDCGIEITSSGCVILELLERVVIHYKLLPDKVIGRMLVSKI